MIEVQVYGGNAGDLAFIELPVDAVDAYIGLVKKFGFEDDDLNEYEFNRAAVGPKFVTIYVDSV